MRKVIMLTGLVLGLASGSLVHASDRCNDPVANWQTNEAAVAHMQQFGWDVKRIKVDDGCYEVEGYDIDGNEVEAELEPASLAVRKLEVKFRKGNDSGRYLSAP